MMELIRADLKEIITDFEKGVFTITLNRPDYLNALSSTVKDELMECLKQADTDDRIKVVVLTGSGRAFCAGGDLKNFGHMDVTEARKHLTQIGGIVSFIYSMEKPVIAAVNGYATGAGCNLAIACDLVFAARSAKFCQSFIKVGLIPDGGGSYSLPRLIGPSKAKDLIFTGRMLSAMEAEQLGLITYAVDDEQLTIRVMDYALTLAQGPSDAIGIAKMLVNQSLNTGLEQMLEYERFAQATCMQTENHKEGLRAFFEKRKPNFT
jgi:2-(1,2-epoxy-1,2-dihydrophenyl)acetyl-CoA isomerase